MSLQKDVNDLLTQTDKGTPMGELFRQYWLPALLAEELPENDCPPVRVELLGEKMIAFRDTEGRYGLIEEFCAHRRVSLWFGRNEECGLRCPYHGWKFDVKASASTFRRSPRAASPQGGQAQAYPLIKGGGVLWTYMGPPANRPPVPAWEFCNVAPEQTYSRSAAGMQLAAGAGRRHRFRPRVVPAPDELERDPLFRGAKANKYNLGDLKPVFDVSPSDGGLYIGARRNAEGGKNYWRVTQWVMPCFTMIPPRADHPQHGHFWVPINDENCWTWSYDYHPNRPLTAAERQACLDGKGVHVATIRVRSSPCRTRATTT